MRPPLRLPTRRSSGLTLLEVLLTLAIMTAVAALSLPLLDGMLSNRRLVRGAEVVRVHMMQARLEAMRSGRTQIMRCPPAGSTMTIVPFRNMADLTEAADQIGSGAMLLQGGQPTAAPLPTETNEEPRTVELPEEITFADSRVESTTRSILLANQAAAQTQASDDTSLPILFYADGSTSNAAVTVQQSGAGRIVIALRGLTGEATVG